MSASNPIEINSITQTNGNAEHLIDDTYGRNETPNTGDTAQLVASPDTPKTTETPEVETATTPAQINTAVNRPTNVSPQHPPKPPRKSIVNPPTTPNETQNDQLRTSRTDQPNRQPNRQLSKLSNPQRGPNSPNRPSSDFVRNSSSNNSNCSPTNNSKRGVTTNWNHALPYAPGHTHNRTTNHSLNNKWDEWNRELSRIERRVQTINETFKNIGEMSTEPSETENPNQSTSVASINNLVTDIDSDIMGNTSIDATEKARLLAMIASTPGLENDEPDNVNVDEVKNLPDVQSDNRYHNDAQTDTIDRFGLTDPQFDDTWNDRMYQQLVRKVLKRGEQRDDRTGTGTRALFGELLEFDLRGNRLPLLNCRRLSFKSILEELLWFLRGETDSKILERRGVHIWTEHATRDVLTKRGFPSRREGDIGPLYGFQWRFAGLRYTNCEANYAAQKRTRGYDQIAYILDELTARPHSRRILLNSWNVADIAEMVLPPCHVMFQLFADNANELSGMLYSRSADIGLGLPFNIASYAILLHAIAKKVGRTAKTLKVIIGDAHIYNDHIDAITEIAAREPRPSPRVYIDSRSFDKPLHEYSTDFFHLFNYHPHEPVRMRVSV